MQQRGFPHPRRRASYMAFLWLCFNSFTSTLKSSRDTEVKALWRVSDDTNNKFYRSNSAQAAPKNLIENKDSQKDSTLPSILIQTQPKTYNPLLSQPNPYLTTAHPDPST